MEYESFENAVIAGMMNRSMTRSLGPASQVRRTHGARAITDVTGFGLIGPAREMAEAGRVALALAIPLLAAAPALAEDKVLLQLGESAERLVTQDRRRAHLRVEIGGNDPRALQGQVNQTMAAALDRAKAVAAVEAETQGYYVYEDNTHKRGQRWRGSQSLGLTSLDSGALLALVGQL